MVATPSGQLGIEAVDLDRFDTNLVRWDALSVITETLDISPEAFEAGTGWQIKPEGACKGEVCVPLPDGWSAAHAADRLGMAVVSDPSGLTAFGPESLNGRALVTAQAPKVVLPDLDGNDFDLASLRGKKVVLVAWAPY